MPHTAEGNLFFLLNQVRTEKILGGAVFLTLFKMFSFHWTCSDKSYKSEVKLNS